MLWWWIGFFSAYLQIFIHLAHTHTHNTQFCDAPNPLALRNYGNNIRIFRNLYEITIKISIRAESEKMSTNSWYQLHKEKPSVCWINSTATVVAPVFQFWPSRYLNCSIWPFSHNFGRRPDNFITSFFFGNCCWQIKRTNVMWLQMLQKLRRQIFEIRWWESWCWLTNLEIIFSVAVKCSFKSSSLICWLKSMIRDTGVLPMQNWRVSHFEGGSH